MEYNFNSVRRLNTQKSTNVCSQALIHTAKWTGIMWEWVNLSIIQNGSIGFEPRRIS